MELTLWHLDPLRASAFVPLPKWIREKLTVTNVVGTGDDCFKWAVLAGLHPAAENPQRMEKLFTICKFIRFFKFNLSSPLYLPLHCLPRRMTLVLMFTLWKTESELFSLYASHTKQ